MRKLTWFAGGFAAMCLLMVGSFPVLWLAIPALPILVLWHRTQPKDKQDWVEMRSNKSLRYVLWQVCRRGTAVILGCGAGLCWFCVYYFMVCMPAKDFQGIQTISGTVLAQPQATSTGSYAVTLRLDSGEDLRLYVPETWKSVQLGDHIQAEGQVEFTGFTYGEEVTYDTAKGVFLQGTCEQAPTVERPAVLPLACWPAWAAQRLKEGIQGAFDKACAPLAVAVTLGDKSLLDDGLYADMTRAGVTHAAVVSGLHVSFLVGVLMVLCRNRRRCAVALIPVLVFYAVMAGGTPSAFRAVWMQGAALAVPVVGREQDAPSAMALSLLVLLVQNPFSVAQVGLQLSFLSVSGILLLTPRIYRGLTGYLEEHTLRGWKKVVGKLWQGMSASVSASLGAMVLTVPLVGVVFGQVSLVAPVANILTLWAMSVLMMCALALGLLGLWLPGVAALLGQGAGLLGHYTLWVVHKLGTFPYGVLDMKNIYHVIWLVGAYAVFGLLLWGGVTLPRALWTGVGLLALLALPVGLSAFTVARSDLVVGAVNVGQGASTVLMHGDHTVLVDCGGSEGTSAGDLSADYLASVGRTEVDVLLLTHLDKDHFNGVERLLDRVDVEEVYVPVSAKDQEEAQQLETWLEEKSIPCQWVEDEVDLTLGEMELRVIPPLGSGTTNEEGLSVLSTVDDFDVLITGDADSYVEHMIVKYFVIPNIELLMVGHHGSADSTSMELLGWARPELGIISVGEDNLYGHPDQETLERLYRSGVEVHRTDQEGTVTVVVQGENVGIW